MIRRGVVSLNHHAARFRIVPERHAGSPPNRHGVPFSIARLPPLRESARYFEHLGWTPSTSWATT
jgi:hypothetical protein